jgi:hypothetical protein
MNTVPTGSGSGSGSGSATLVVGLVFVRFLFDQSFLHTNYRLLTQIRGLFLKKDISQRFFFGKKYEKGKERKGKCDRKRKKGNKKDKWEVKR